MLQNISFPRPYFLGAVALRLDHIRNSIDIDSATSVRMIVCVLLPTLLRPPADLTTSSSRVVEPMTVDFTRKRVCSSATRSKRLPLQTAPERALPYRSGWSLAGGVE